MFEPAIAAIPAELWGKREAAELYHELLEHRWYQSQRKGRDVGRDEALRSYVDFLRSLPDERRAMLGDDGSSARSRGGGSRPRGAWYSSP